MIDETSRERFIYPYKEHSSYSTINFVKRAIVYFGYKSNIIQTDNGQEFTHIKKTNTIYPLDVLCFSLTLSINFSVLEHLGTIVEWKKS